MVKGLKNEKIRLTIENFRGIKKSSLEFGKVNILIGGNNSGKTTILESLFLLPNPFRPAPYIARRIGRLNALRVLSLIHSTLGSEANIFLFHYYKGGKATITFQKDTKTKVSLQFLAKNNTIDILLKDKRKYYLGYVHKESSEQMVEDYLRVSTPSGEHLLFPPSIRTVEYCSSTGEAVFFHPLLLDFICQYFSAQWVTLRASGMTSMVAQRISEAVGADFNDILLEPFIGGSQTIYFRDKMGRGIRFGDVGSGTQVFVALALLYEHIKPKMLLIDDIESHMNPSLLTYLASWLADTVKDTDLFVTTHSLEAAKILAGVLEDYNPRIKLLELREGILKDKDLTLEELEQLEKAGIDVRQRGIFL